MKYGTDKNKNPETFSQILYIINYYTEISVLTIG